MQSIHLRLLFLLLLTVPLFAGINPANGQASESCIKVLRYIADLKNRDENRVLSGQNCGHGQGIQSVYPDLMTKLEEQTGKTCALLGVDYGLVDKLDYQTTNRVLIEHWNKGGLVTISWHPDNPWTGGDSWDTRLADLTELIDPQSSVYTSWMAELKKIGDALRPLRDAGVVVLWRPFHEMNGNWFWWCMNSHPNDPQPYVNVWKHMFTLFSDTYGLNNLLWVFSTTSKRDASWTRPVDYYYPGSEYVDMVGVDIYSNIISITDYKVFQDLGKPIALTEFGPGDASSGGGDYDNTKTIKAIRAKYPAITYWLQWHDWDSNGTRVHKSIVYNKNAAQLLNDPWVITRDEVDWRNITGASSDDFQDSLMPNDFHVTSIYPNPFNDAATLTFSLKRPIWLSIAVFDINGCLVDRLTDDMKPAGDYTLKWDAGLLPSGVYMMVFQSASQMRSVKCVLYK
ncbi:MAG: T9SS C-terminal target domain-containing protein [Calditrichaeota bacterium]|nr:MAG: T9SS C-terminal target domain-containing protein [Calditrichota bacterium]